MKTKYAILVLVAVYALAVSSFAGELQPPHNQPSTIRVKTHGGTGAELTIESNSETVKIKAHGATVAELKVAGNGAVVIRGGVQTFEKGEFRLIPVNDGLLTVQINCLGGFPINIQSDEVRFGSERPAILFGPELAR